MKKLHAVFFIFLAFTIQIQITLFVSEDYAGLRVNAADILMPVMGLVIIISLFLHKSNWPEFHIKHIYGWLTGLGLIIFLALINSYFLYGHWNQWGLINKLIGWLVLSGYFFLGGWLAYNSNKKHLLLFIKIAVYFFAASTTAITLLIILQSYGLNSNYYKIITPMGGFMANKNSFIFLTLSILGFTTCFQKILFPKWLVYLLWFLMPLIFIYTGARAGLLAFPFICVIFFLVPLTVPWKQIALCLIVGICFTSLLYVTMPTNMLRLYHIQTASMNATEEHVQNETTNSFEQKLYFKGDSFRLKVLEATKNMIIDRPFLGSGLGSAKIEQERQWGKFYAIIDSTPLWLWAETGLIGLLTFLIFYFICIKQLWRNSKNSKEGNVARALNQSVLITLIIFTIMCLFHEILYTRFLWFFLGLALAYPFKEEHS